MWSIRNHQRLYSCSLNLLRGYGTRQESRQWKQKPNRKARLSLILSEDVPHLGSKGEMVHVKGGHGRNFLLPKGKAVYATQENMKLYDTVEKRLFIPKRGSTRFKVDHSQGGTEFMVSFFKDKTVTIEQKEIEGGWNIYEYQIAFALRKQLQCHAPLDCIIIPEPITDFGTSEVKIVLNNNTTVSLSINVIPKKLYIEETTEQENVE